MLIGACDPMLQPIHVFRYIDFPSFDIVFGHCSPLASANTVAPVTQRVIYVIYIGSLLDWC